MQRAQRITRAHTIALPRPHPAVTGEWILVATALAALFAAMLAP
jgi:hypothetical protein